MGYDFEWGDLCEEWFRSVNVRSGVRLSFVEEVIDDRAFREHCLMLCGRLGMRVDYERMMRYVLISSRDLCTGVDPEYLLRF